MNKKTLMVMIISAFMLTSFVGCGNSNTDNAVKNQMNNAANDVKDSAENIGNDVKNGAENLTEDLTGNNSSESVKNNNGINPYQFDYNGMYREYTNNDSGYYESSESYKYKQEGDGVYTSVKKISGIEDVKIALIGEKAYCAVKTKTGSSSLSDEKKGKISTLIKEKYPQVKNVYFSDKVEHYNSLSNAIKQGLDNITDDILNLFELK
ncbi:YhcN/YlaJ family sporulation lipoprotein [Anaerofustis butyriciformans]|uniref:YhcN/YlaJ family sporulation lipoprotein n=1 Tax=Anaerofustis butyriciformans TaxID=3108533 RepID=UPI003F8B2FCA